MYVRPRNCDIMFKISRDIPLGYNRVVLAVASLLEALQILRKSQSISILAKVQPLVTRPNHTQVYISLYVHLASASFRELDAFCEALFSDASIPSYDTPRESNIHKADNAKISIYESIIYIRMTSNNVV